MDVEALLDQCRRDYLDDYTDMVSGAEDRLFRDSSLVRWFNEGQRRFCNNTKILTTQGPTNSTHSVVTLATSVQDYTLTSKVLRVLSARLDDTEYDLSRGDYNTIRSTGAQYRDQDYFDANQPGTATPGRPQWFATDIAGKIIRFQPTPSSVENGITVDLRIVHLPLTELSADSLTTEPDIPEEFHTALALYAASKALSGQSIDSASRIAAADFMAQYRVYEKEAKDSKRDFTFAQPRIRFGGWASDGS